MQPILCYLIPLQTGGEPTHPIAGPPPGIWPSPGHPAHPIAPGGPPVGIWPSPGHPAHPIAPGGPPPGIWPSPGVPTHPIYIPVDPPPDSGLSPEHPIYIPVEPPQPPLGIWGGGNVPMPTPPIYIPDWVDEETKQKIKDFLFGNLPPAAGPHKVAPEKKS
jgi:hypothetical protein